MSVLTEYKKIFLTELPTCACPAALSSSLQQRVMEDGHTGEKERKKNIVIVVVFVVVFGKE
jgi:hypothetical protein